MNPGETPNSSDTLDPLGLECDFLGGPVAHRRKFGGGRGQPLPKAAGFSKGRTPDVIDATAGLGRDAFLLASLGARVTLIERSPAMHQLLAQGLARAADDDEVGPIVARMTLILGDARDVLVNLRADVVMVDPMHPERDSSALVKKQMRQVRALVGLDGDATQVVQAALSAATNRVVLKWPLRAPPIAGLVAPSHTILSKTLRYDVFMVPGEA